MPFRYDKMFQLFKDNKVSLYYFEKNKYISSGTAQKLRYNKPINTKTLETFCEYFHCQASDLMTYYSEDEDEL